MSRATQPWSAQAEALLPMIVPYLARQRWARHDAEPAELHIERGDRIQEGTPEALWLLLRSGPDLYQLVVGLRPAEDPIDLGERDTIGVVPVSDRSWFAYDGMADPDIVRPLAASMGVRGVEEAIVRPVGAEQSNSSVVLGQRVILKLYRRLQPGPNPDVEVTGGLDRVGFNHLASPLGVWSRDGFDLAVAQEFLAGGSEGWALALTSLRDLYASEDDDPASAGGDFAAEAHRIGDMTARLHVALAAAFGVRAGASESWAESLVQRAEALGLGPALVRRVRSLAEGIRGLGSPVPTQRVHGDYHLGQVMRTDRGWYILDFEGEPARPLGQRLRPASPLKDVTGLLRSLDYAARFALGEAAGGEIGPAGRADAWERHNGAAFLDGYLAVEGVDSLLPAGGSERQLVLGAYELDKALYELDYEAAYRPAWVPIPAGAIVRILSRLAS